MDSAHKDILDAMGVTLWLPRAAAPADAAADASAESAAEPVEPASAPVEPAHAQSDVAGMGWDALTAAVAQCTRCRLHAGRRQTVFGVGNRTAEWMIVGEGPGQEEDRRGEPFVGPAGRLLDAMLKAAGRARDDVYIANIVKCRPPNNRNPSADEAESCAPFLARQIALLRPRLIIAAGRVAAQNLLGTDASLGRLRGKIHRHSQSGVAVLVTYHPAYLLRQPADKLKSWQDLKLAMRFSEQEST